MHDDKTSVENLNFNLIEQDTDDKTLFHREHLGSWSKRHSRGHHVWQQGTAINFERREPASQPSFPDQGQHHNRYGAQEISTGSHHHSRRINGVEVYNNQPYEPKQQQ